MESLCTVIYTSLLAPDVNPTAIAEIVRSSRSNNRLRNITGMLVFDGIAFCQYLEGKSDVIDTLVETLLADSRHTDVVIRYRESLSRSRRFPEWSMAYGLNPTESLVDLFSGITGNAATRHFERLLPLIDLDPLLR